MYKIIWILLLLLTSTSVFSQNATGIQSGTFTDPRDGNIYNWVKVGQQIWMTKNISYLPKVNGLDQTSGSEPYYYVNGYNGTSATEAKSNDNYIKYGVLYNWPDAVNACPKGWHLPSHEEWNQLAQYTSDQLELHEKNSFGDWPEVGKHLKAKSGWHLNKNGIDTFGFTALPGGSRNLEGYFFLIDTDGTWWSATESGSSDAWFRHIICHEDALFQSTTFKASGFSVRCVRD